MLKYIISVRENIVIVIIIIIGKALSSHYLPSKILSVLYSKCFISQLIFIFQMSKMGTREVSHLHKVTQPARTGTQGE